MDLVENKGLNVTSPDRNRVSTYRKAAEDAIQQHRATSSSRGAFGSVGGGGQTLGGSNRFNP